MIPSASITALLSTEPTPIHPHHFDPKTDVTISVYCARGPVITYHYRMVK